ncbi:MAG: hypothetical protein O6927_09885, partial [Gammaproteobacteria bacterium]|nr:hypothetical protein [Gammaproteobacteria bacterium]
KLRILSAAAVILLFGLHPAQAEPVALEDNLLNQVTAGNAQQGRGVVVGNSSTSVFHSTTGISLSGEAQGIARGLNLVNSAESAVANTINIWEGNTVTITVEDGNSKPVLEVNQVNQVTQTQVQSATLSGYSRPEAELTEIQRHTNSESHLSRTVDSNSTTNIFEEETLATTISSASVNTRTRFNLGDNFFFEGNLGQGVAVGGFADIEIEGGSADVALMIGGGITVEADTGDIDFLGFDFGETGAAAGIRAEGSISLLVSLELPNMEIELSGAGCGVVMGSCDASSLHTEITQTRTDNSTLDVVENHQAGDSDFSIEQISIFRSSFTLGSAQAEYIVVDDSSLTLNSEVVLELTDSAQKEVEGMNIVNAIGSNVANATNISRAAHFKSLRSTLVLNQFNTVQHGQ